MWSPARVVVLLAAPVFLSACGGRVTSGAPSPEPAGDTGAVSSGGSASAGSAATGGTAPMNEPPIELNKPPFETPWWLWASWQDNLGNPVTDQCQAGLTEAEALAAITSFGDQAGAVPVDAGGLLATIEQFRDPETRNQAPSPIVIHLFATPDRHLGAVSVIRSEDGLIYYYFVLSEDCHPVRLGFYMEHIGVTGCDRVGPSHAPLWGIPELSPNLRACYAANGYYAFEAETIEDSCARTPARFTGVYTLRSPDPSYGELTFVETAFAEHRRMTFRVTLQGKAGIALIDGGNECGPRTAQLKLDEAGQLRVEDDRIRCMDTDPERHCTWKMQSPKVYGPLN